MAATAEKKTDAAAPRGGGKEVVEARAFDITKFATAAGGLIAAVAAATAAAVKEFGDAPTAVVVGALGVTATAVLGVSLVMAADMIARGIATGKEKPDEPAGNPGGKARSENSTPTGLQVRIEGSDGHRPVLAVRDEGSAGSAFLIPTGAKIGDPPSFDGPVRWVPATEVRACVSQG